MGKLFEAKMNRFLIGWMFRIDGRYISCARREDGTLEPATGVPDWLIPTARTLDPF